MSTVSPPPPLPYLLRTLILQQTHFKFQNKSETEIQSNENKSKPQNSDTQETKCRIRKRGVGGRRRQPVHHEEATVLEHPRNSVRSHRSQPPIRSSGTQRRQGQSHCHASYLSSIMGYLGWSTRYYLHIYWVFLNGPNSTSFCSFLFFHKTNIAQI